MFSYGITGVTLLRKRVVLLVALCLVLSSIILASCSPSPKKAILGKWEGVNTEFIYEFFEEGTLTMSKDDDSGGPAIVRYEFIDANHIKIDAGSFCGALVCQVKFSDDKLFLEGSDGSSLEFVRLEKLGSWQ